MSTDLWTLLLAGTVAAALVGGPGSGWAAQIHVGAAETSITPDRPVALEGQFRLRISKGVDSPIMECDLVMARDVVAHLSNENVRRLLIQVKESGAKWLLVTNFPRTMRNQDCQDGSYRPLKLTLFPFKLPEPDRALADSENKVMALWSTDQL